MQTNFKHVKCYVINSNWIEQLNSNEIHFYFSFTCLNAFFSFVHMKFRYLCVELMSKSITLMQAFVNELVCSHLNAVFAVFFFPNKKQHFFFVDSSVWVFFSSSLLYTVFVVAFWVRGNVLFDFNQFLLLFVSLYTFSSDFSAVS